MTALQAPQTSNGPQRFRLLRGRRLRRPVMAPWLVVTVVAILGFLGLGFARTSLDRAAFELDELDKAISIEHSANRDLKVELAWLENPARIAPLAEEMGMVIPVDTKQLLVDFEMGVLAVTDSEEASQ